ncbi:MAG: hypothetical protein ABIJ48_06430 [Actinomycetota bacterium]
MAAADMFPAQGLRQLRAPVARRLDQVLGEGICCFSPESLVAQLDVTPEGLLVNLDETARVPHRTGPLEFLLPRGEATPLVDMPERWPAPFAVTAVWCSLSGQPLVLKDRPRLPEVVAAKRATIFAAAISWDCAGLEAPAGEGGGFPWGFAGPVHGHSGKAEARREEESRGHAALWWPAQTITLAPADRACSCPVSDPVMEERHVYVWPACTSRRTGRTYRRSSRPNSSLSHARTSPADASVVSTSGSPPAAPGPGAAGREPDPYPSAQCFATWEAATRSM